MSDKSQTEKGRALVAQLRQRGAKVVVDLGCGFRKSGNIGIDAVELEGVDLVCCLGFESIPLDNESVDRVQCVNFLEHVPKAYYSERDRTLKYPIIFLINEVWRILRAGGTFVSRTPCYPHPEIHQDPTHLSVWTQESMQYFCGKYPVARSYGIKTCFEVLENRKDRFYLFSRLQKPRGQDS